MDAKVTPFPVPRQQPGPEADLTRRLAAIGPARPGAAFVSVPADIWELLKSGDLVGAVMAGYAQGRADTLQALS